MASGQESTWLPFCPGGAGAADAGDLLDDGVDLDPGAQGQRDEAAGGLDLGGGAAPGLAHLGEDLAEAQVILVDGDVEFAAAGGDEFGDAGGALGPGPGGDVLQLGGFLGRSSGPVLPGCRPGRWSRP